MKTIRSKYCQQVFFTRFKIFVLAIVLLFACEPPVYFLSPQPSGIKNLPGIPTDYTGSYFNSKDSTRLVVTASSVIHYETDYSIMTREQLYEEIDTVIDHDTLVYVSPNWTLEINLIGDSAEFISRTVDTFFLAGPENYIRKWREFLFLNMNTNPGKWQVFIMKIQNERLYFDEMLKATEVDTFKNMVSITPVFDAVENIVTEYYLDPSKRKLSRILKSKEVSFDYVRQ